MTDGLLDQVEQKIFEALNLRRYGGADRKPKTRATWEAFVKAADAVNWTAVIADAAKRVEGNWNEKECSSSKRNWRFEKMLHISEKNYSEEKRVEKAVALHGGESWVNQVPVCSGVNIGKDSKRAVDLAYKTNDRLDLIELKRDHKDADHPLFASVEMAIYGLVYRFSRMKRRELGYSEAKNPLVFGPDKVELKVLAPTGYFQRYDQAALAFLQRGLARAFEALPTEGFSMTFKLESYAANPDLKVGDRQGWQDMIDARAPVIRS